MDLITKETQGADLTVQHVLIFYINNLRILLIAFFYYKEFISSEQQLYQWLIHRSLGCQVVNDPFGWCFKAHFKAFISCD